MGVVEGLTATIAQHNPEVDFQTIWASDSEEGKLDIHYREAVNDLENELTKWLSATSTQFDLQALAGNLMLQLKVQDFWPPKLSGLLSNQIQKLYQDNWNRNNDGFNNFEDDVECLDEKIIPDG